VHNLTSPALEIHAGERVSLVITQDGVYGAGENEYLGKRSFGSGGSGNTLGFERIYLPSAGIPSLKTITKRSLRKHSPSPYYPNAYRFFFDRVLGLADEIFMPNLWGCDTCLRYVKPLLNKQCPYCSLSE
jgi:hypothetical protein